MILNVLDESLKQGIEEDMLFYVAELCLDYVMDVAGKLNIIEINSDLATQAFTSLIKQAGQAYGFDTEGLEANLATSFENTTFTDDQGNTASMPQQSAPEEEMQVEGAAPAEGGM